MIIKKVPDSLIDVTIADLFKMLKLQRIYLNSMIYNVCDYSMQRCPMSSLPCDGDCELQYRFRISKNQRNDAESTQSS